MSILGLRYMEEGTPVSRSVKIWLCVGLFMVFMQIVIGGITRLTGSGLSITKWDIVTGAVPPLNEADWMQEFEHYQATPQYLKINQGMSLQDFKFIYFWEYLHRLWARWMGFVFLLPFCWFMLKGMLPRSLVRRLGGVILLAALAASFGWIMVASGLINRPWVNAYKLTIHLSIGFSVLAWLLWTTFHVLQPIVPIVNNRLLKRLALAATFVAALQFILGGLMSGMKAGLFFPTWPDMNGVYIPKIIFDINQWNVDNIVNYDTQPFMSALIQFLHRSTAYLLTVMILYLFYKINMNPISKQIKVINWLLISMLISQVLLGIFTLINCKGHVPVVLGELHQIGGVLLLLMLLYLDYQLFGGKQLRNVGNYKV